MELNLTIYHLFDICVKIFNSIIDISMSIFYLHWNQSYDIIDDKYIWSNKQRQLFLRNDGVLRASWAEFSVLTLKKKRLESRTEESAT